MSDGGLLNKIESYLREFSFRSNPHLKPAGTKIEYSEEMIQELMKCSDDPIYFIKNYVKVVHPDRGVVLMNLYPYQERLVEAYHNNRYVLGMTARQMGKTTTAAAYFVWYMLFNDNKSIAILANKQATADEIMSRIRLAYEHLPKWMQQGVTDFNKRTIKLENGSSVFSAATSSSGIRGRTINCLYIDEIAFVQNSQADDFFTSVYPTITASTESKVIMTSTPNGFNHFYKFWNDAQKGINNFVPVRCYWHEMPGRDQTWYDTQRSILGEIKAAQELDAEFLGSSRQLLNPSVMNRLSYLVPIKEYDGEYTGLKIYESPTKEDSYVITVDVSRGRHLDYSAFVVWKISKYPFSIVATYNNNEISPMMYTNIIQKIGRNYNEAYLLVEINDVGAQVANDLFYEFEYENMFWTKSGDTLGRKGADPFPGIRTTKKTKRVGCANLKDVIEKQQILITDYWFINQLSTFVQSDSGSYQADDGFFDDVVMCGVLFGWLITQPWFKDLTNKDIRLKMYEQSVHQIEEDLVPFGFYSNGLEEEDRFQEGYESAPTGDKFMYDNNAVVSNWNN